MNTLDSFAHAKQQLDALPPSVTLIVLHPHFHGQHRLFAPITQQPDTQTLFLAVPQADYPLDALLTRLHEALQDQLGLDVPAFPAKAEAAADALAQVFDSQGSISLIVDAYDLTKHSETTPFIAALAHRLTSGSRIFLSGRELPMHLIGHKDLQTKIALLPTHADKMMLDYVAAANQTVLEVRALGPGRVLVNGRLIEHWDGVLPRTLFFYFVDRGMTTRDEIFQTFWPNLSTREATNVFHVTKRKISEILGTDLTVYWSGFYRISPDLELHYDVIKFAEAVQNAAVASPDEGIQLLHNGIELYRGPFLSTMDQEWVLQRRDELAMTYAEALAGLARIFRERGDKISALGYYLRAAATNPQREDLARIIMELYRDLGQPQAAIETYERLEAELKHTLDVPPGPQTVELAESIHRLL
ncbi:MAG: bacterial transcriptional activator domain-containing protein [Anaerolineae bacterium]|nr:bacterial transcriptional activator domain-containing protein [Anaerolineae bacterium]